MSAEQTAREIVSKAVQEVAHVDDDLEGSVLLGFVTVAEWMDPEGNRWLSLLSGTASGERAPQWQEQGYLFNGLHHGDEFGRDVECADDDDDN